MSEWISIKQKLPNINEIVKAKIQHCTTKTIKEVILKHIDEYDLSWRFPDDNSELSYDWDVIEWQNL